MGVSANSCVEIVLEMMMMMDLVVGGASGPTFASISLGIKTRERDTRLINIRSQVGAGSFKWSEKLSVDFNGCNRVLLYFVVLRKLIGSVVHVCAIMISRIGWVVWGVMVFFKFNFEWI